MKGQQTTWQTGCISKINLWDSRVCKHIFKIQVFESVLRLPSLWRHANELQLLDVTAYEKRLEIMHLTGKDDPRPAVSLLQACTRGISTFPDTTVWYNNTNNIASHLQHIRDDWYDHGLRHTHLVLGQGTDISAELIQKCSADSAPRRRRRRRRRRRGRQHSAVPELPGCAARYTKGRNNEQRVYTLHPATFYQTSNIILKLVKEKESVCRILILLLPWPWPLI